jgi:hypothetical protein
MAEVLDATPPGLRLTSEPAAAVAEMSLPRRLGLGVIEQHDERPESFNSFASVAIPLWALAIVFAISPARYLLFRGRIARRRVERQRRSGRPKRRTAGWSLNKGLLVGLICGLLVGVGVTFLLTRRGTSSGDAGDASTATTAPSAGAAAAAIEAEKSNDPMVGVWRVDLSPITAIYQFRGNGTFSLQFKGVPLPPATPTAVAHQASGTWRVEGKELILRNTASTTPLTIVDEEEKATILSVDLDRLIIEHLDRKGRLEKLTLTRVQPFHAGRRDNPAIVGTWQTHNSRGGIEIHDSGELRMTRYNGGFSTGQWSQEGNALRVVIFPPDDPNAAQRAGRPDLTDTQERLYEALLSPDEQTLSLRLVDPPGQGIWMLHRTSAALEAGPYRPQRGRK